MSLLRRDDYIHRVVFSARSPVKKSARSITWAGTLCPSRTLSNTRFASSLVICITLSCLTLITPALHYGEQHSAILSKQDRPLTWCTTEPHILASLACRGTSFATPSGISTLSHSTSFPLALPFVPPTIRRMRSRQQKSHLQLPPVVDPLRDRGMCKWLQTAVHYDNRRDFKTGVRLRQVVF